MRSTPAINKPTLFATTANTVKADHKKEYMKHNEIEFVKIYSAERHALIDKLVSPEHVEALTDAIELWQAEILRDGDPKNERFTSLKVMILIFGATIDTNTDSEDSISKIPDKLMKKVDGYLEKNNDGKSNEFKKKHMPEIDKLKNEVFIFSKIIPMLILRKAADRKAEITMEGLRAYRNPQHGQQETTTCVIL
jgi:hypothetical protein